ncbi:hypothetical protein BGAL_0445g00010 [Botrytis galanthina]|uniref:Uncharacterized protein n=1 Tax=Botrytis galanthina TaxID=278940 RepID=A0A4S8QLY8_9HELO|nr:hypothetical protein BGAL_0445g00010 [Botrytis galanthina]
MPLNPTQKSKLANKSAANDRANKQSWLHSKLHFLLPERNLKKSSKPQAKLIKARRHDVTGPHSKRKKHSRTENSYRSQAAQTETWRHDVTDSYPETNDSRDPSTPPPALTFSQKQADYYDNLSPETRKTYEYPLPAKAPEYKIPRKPSPTTPPPPALTFSQKQADYYDNLSPETRKTYGYPLPAKEPSHSRPGSSRMNAPVEQFQAQGLSFEMLENQYYSLEAQDRQNKKYHQTSAKSLRSEARFHKPSAVTTHHSPGEIPQIEARPLPPIPKPHRSSEVPIHSSARSQRPRIPSTPAPIENIRQLETGCSPRIRITSSSHQPAETPIYSSARSYRPRAPKIPTPSVDNVRLETGFLEKFPISHQPPTIPHQPSSRPHRPPTQLIPKPKSTVHFEQRPSQPVPNTLRERRRPPLEPPQPRLDRVEPHPPRTSSGKRTEKKRRWWKILWKIYSRSTAHGIEDEYRIKSRTLPPIRIEGPEAHLRTFSDVVNMTQNRLLAYLLTQELRELSPTQNITSYVKQVSVPPPHHTMPEEKARRVSKYTEHDIDGPIKRPPVFVFGPRPLVEHKIKRKPVPPKIIPPTVPPPASPDIV